MAEREATIDELMACTHRLCGCAPGCCKITVSARPAPAKQTDRQEVLDDYREAEKADAQPGRPDDDEDWRVL